MAHGGNVDRISQGINVAGGSGGGGDTASGSGALIVGVNDINHTLGSIPVTAVFNDADGRTIPLEWHPKAGFETTIMEVTALKAEAAFSYLISA